MRRLKEHARCLVRIEVKIQGHLLREHGWASLESWREAYAEGRYEAIFEEMVRWVFRLDEALRHKMPREEVWAKLTATEKEILEAYFAGRPGAELPSIRAGATVEARTKLRSKWRKQLLTKTDIDIGIPWAAHQELRQAELGRVLQYPGDYHPPVEMAPHCFCQANWRFLLQSMQGRLEDMQAEAIDA